MPPQGNPYNIDWIFASGSDVHVANHRDWFITYTPFLTYLGGTSSSTEVLGVGDVALEAQVETNPENGSTTHRTLVLHDVLHVPASTVNIVGGPILKEYGAPTVRSYHARARDST
jgi:hypothetical protein